MSIVGVCCGKGSPGATFLSVNLASALSDQAPKPILLDLDHHGGDVSAFLGLDPRKGLFPLKLMARHGLVFDDLAAEVEQRRGISCIAGIPREADADPAFLELILNTLEGRATVIADLGRIDSISAPLARHCDLVLLAVRPDLVSVYGAQRALRILEETGVSKSDTLLVINGLQWRHAADVAEISGDLEVAALRIVPLVRAAARRALLRQEPLKKGRAADAIRALGSAVLEKLGAESRVEEAVA